MFRLLAGGFALALVALSGGPVAAEDKKDKEKLTTWVRDAGDLALKFEIGKETAKYSVFVGENGCVITAKIKWDKDVVTSEVTAVEVKGDFPAAPKKGAKFSFQWVAKDGTATLSDFKGDDDNAKGAIEGEYKLKK